MSQKNIFILSCVLACSFLFASDIIKGPTDQISVPQLINYQGKLTNTSGNPVSDSIYSITFRFFSAASGGTALWTETQSVQTRNGLYNCLLGSTTPITSIPIDGNLYLEMQVNPNAAMTPRIRIVSSAYSYLAKKADTAYYAASAPLTRPITPPITTTEITDGAVTNIKLGADAITTDKILNGTILRADVVTNFKAPYSDTADYVRNINVPYVDSARVAVNAYNANQLQNKDTTALSAKFVDENQTAGGDLTGTYPNPTITNNAVNTVKIADTNVTMAKIQRAGAATGQVLKWTGSAWAPSADVGSSGEFLPLAGGTMTGAITSTGDPAITMGKGNFGTGNTNAGTDAFVAGRNNNARGAFSVVSGGGGYNAIDSNSAIDYYSVISGGTRNVASGYSATVGGGTYVRARGIYSVVAGGGGPNAADSNSAIGGNSTVGGGRSNYSTNFCATVGGGNWNAATGDYATVAGGKFNYARGFSSVIAGGGGPSLVDSNSATGDYSMILGGRRNTASGSYSSASGRRAKANHDGAFVWGDNTDADFASTGANQFLIRANGNVGINTNSPSSPLTVNGIIQSTTGGIKFPDNSVQTTAGVSGSYLPIAGGTMTGAITSTGDPSITMGQANFGTGNINPGTQAFVAGRNNKARGNYSVVSGGGGANVADSNSAIGNYSAIGGGTHNTASGYEATVGGGISNTASGDGVVIGGGFINTASQQYATVGGGQQNTASGAQATIGGGGSNTASSSHATVGGGYADTASGQYATIGGGYNNTASYFYATVGGGRNNAASNYSATVGGGFLNSARGQYSVVSGGGGSTAADSNSAMGDWSAIAGGRGNIASGDYSFAAGRKAKTNHAGAFVWADGTDADFTSTGTNQFLIRANGNVGINTNSPSSPLTVAGMIQSTTDGYKFPDNSVQTTAATGGGTVTSVGTGDGLTGGPITTSGTISIADNGVTTAKIIDSAVTSAKILNGTITGNDIAIPLSLTGSASFPNAIIKVRNNSTGPGISVDSAGFGGLSVNYSFTDGVIIKRADGTAFWVDTAGGQAMRIIYAASDGIGIDDVGWNGLWAMHVGDNGVSIDSAETNGILAHGNFAGGDFYAGNAGAVGLSAHSYNNSSSDTAIQVFGKGFATGGWSTGGLLDNKSAPCLISPELGIVTAGSGTLSNGKADINFEPLFAENTRTDIPIRITVTPKGKPAGLVYVTESKSTGFKVEVEPIPGLEKNSTDITFDWIAFGTLKDYQTKPAAQAQWQQMIQERIRQADARKAQKQERNELLNKAKELR